MSETRISGVFAWEALDSRGTPTVACEVTLAGGGVGQAVMPSGASTGRHEAKELRDDDERYGGRGVRQAVANVMGPLAAAVTGKDARQQEEIDDALRGADSTPDLSRLGANAVLAVSVASALAVAAAERRPLYQSASLGRPQLPLPMVNVISGGAHAGRSIDVQDFLVVPVGAGSFAEAMEWAWRVRQATAEVISERGSIADLVADEGGLGPPLPSNRMALELLDEAISRARLLPGDDVGIAIDVAATQLLSDSGRYHLSVEDRNLASEELVAELVSWCADFPIVSIEDPLAEDDWAGWREATTRLGPVQLVGDDLFATNAGRLRYGMNAGVANAVLVKPNQNGTLSGTRALTELARETGYATILSARSGDTEDSWLADLAVAWRTGQVKVGSLTRSERTAKWNRLLRIEVELGDKAEYAGASLNMIHEWTAPPIR